MNEWWKIVECIWTAWPDLYFAFIKSWSSSSDNEISSIKKSEARQLKAGQVDWLRFRWKYRLMLPKELMVIIFDHLSLKDILACMQVQKSWYEYLRADTEVDDHWLITFQKSYFWTKRCQTLPHAARIHPKVCNLTPAARFMSYKMTKWEPVEGLKNVFLIFLVLTTLASQQLSKASSPILKLSIGSLILTTIGISI